MQTRKKIKLSIFLKLMVLVIIFIVLVNISIGFVIKFSFERFPPDFMNLHMRLLSEHIVDQAGFPPDTNIVKSIISGANLGVRIETPDFNWTSSDRIPPINVLSKSSDFKNDVNNFVVREKGRPFFIYRKENGYLVVHPLPPREEFNFDKAIIASVILLTLFTSMLYFSLRWIFGPIKELSSAVEQISKGNFNTEININRNDELGSLGSAITEMKTNISNMIKSKETLLIDVSHELRSPLTRIKLANEFIEDEKIKNKIREDVKEMESMISELLETYRLENANEKLNIKQNDIVKLVERVVSKFDDHKIILLKESISRLVSFDKEKMEIAVRNILDNAIKYSEGKPVEVRIFENPENEDETLISIKDNGKGIEEVELKKIFEPFYRIDKSRDKKIKGYGLGLSLVKKILDEHGAELDVKSKLNEGTEFVIHLK